MSQKGLFISIEGVEGVGKSTAIRAIQERLDGAKIPYVVTREPGGTPVAEEIRKILLNPQETMAADTELLLMFASRAQNVAEVVLPALAKGRWVIADRFVDASFAYQGGGRKIPEARIAELAKWVLDDLRPDVTLLLDAPVEVGFSRIKSRGDPDRIEKENIEFFERVRQTYLDLAAKFPARFRIIHSDRNHSEVKQEILAALNPLLEQYLK